MKKIKFNSAYIKTKMQDRGVFNVVRGLENIHEFKSKVKLWLEIVNEEIH
jgi:hypothetical protein